MFWEIPTSIKIAAGVMLALWAISGIVLVLT